jgi:hypothetical protein
LAGNVHGSRQGRRRHATRARCGRQRRRARLGLGQRQLGRLACWFLDYRLLDRRQALSPHAARRQRKGLRRTWRRPPVQTEMRMTDAWGTGFNDSCVARQLGHRGKAVIVTSVQPPSRRIARRNLTKWEQVSMRRHCREPGDSARPGSIEKSTCSRGRPSENGAASPTSGVPRRSRPTGSSTSPHAARFRRAVPWRAGQGAHHS